MNERVEPMTSQFGYGVILEAADTQTNGYACEGLGNYNSLTNVNHQVWVCCCCVCVDWLQHQTLVQRVLWTRNGECKDP